MSLVMLCMIHQCRLFQRKNCLFCLFTRFVTTLMCLHLYKITLLDLSQNIYVYMNPKRCIFTWELHAFQRRLQNVHSAIGEGYSDNATRRSVSISAIFDLMTADIYGRKAFLDETKVHMTMWKIITFAVFSMHPFDFSVKASKICRVIE